MKRLAYLGPLALLMISACGQSVPQKKPSTPTTAAEAMISGLYKRVIAHPPIAYLSDRKAFAPYLSKALLQRFDDNSACFDDWRRQYPKTTDKPPFALELGFFSGQDEEGEPQTFAIEKTASAKDGSLRVYVKLTHAEPAFKMVWSVAAVVVRENGRPVVDDVIYLKDDYNYEEWRMSEALTNEPDCKGPRYVGPPASDPPTTTGNVGFRPTG